MMTRDVSGSNLALAESGIGAILSRACGAFWLLGKPANVQRLGFFHSTSEVLRRPDFKLRHYRPVRLLGLWSNSPGLWSNTPQVWR
jgi:hypothetical protein